jgi:hypothetical protein
MPGAATYRKRRAFDLGSSERPGVPKERRRRSQDKIKNGVLLCRFGIRNSFEKLTQALTRNPAILAT